ncbi:MAG: SWIM zinc finger family protein [Candidatus Methanoperedens sp.]|nr:SWIM zinc finger family protein [Candidatus Methanoperedens sp.]
MNARNNRGATLQEIDIKRVYGDTIFYRGQDYFDDDRVTSVIKFKNILTGVVEGSTTYKTDVDLNNLGSECSCPYGINCKHGVAVLLQYLEGEFRDGDEVTKRLDRMSREELRGVIDALISANPSNLMYMGIQAEAGEQHGANSMEALDEQIFHILEFLVDNSEEYGYFYNDYSDSSYGDEIFENLCDAFVKKQLEEGDFARLKEISERDDYDMIASFIHRLSEIENSENLKGLEHFMRDFLDESSYIEFLINCGLTEKARSLIESSENLQEESKFAY